MKLVEELQQHKIKAERQIEKINENFNKKLKEVLDSSKKLGKQANAYLKII